jgi:prolyl 4-hydroxylase
LASKNKRKPPRLEGEWLRWLHTNMARGCSIAELKGILRTEGFEDRAIEAGLASAPKTPAPAPREAIPARAPRAKLQLPNAVAHGGEKTELYTVDDFLTATECAEIVALIRTQLRPSTISTPPGGEYDTAFRTSRTCDLSDEAPAVARLDAKICAAVGFDKSLAEPTQGQHYEIGQVFKSHTDFFKPYEVERFSTDKLGQRTWTFMIYLNDPEGGGETEFPELGLKVTPKRGRAVVWNNLRRSGEGNMATRHQSLPVTGGTKTIITKWFRMPRAKPPAFASGPIGWTQKL